MELLLIDSFKGLDKLIAQKVMGWKEVDWNNPFTKPGETCIYEPEDFDGWAIFQSGGRRGTLWSPSSCMESAWVVVEKMYPNYEFTLERGWIKHPAPLWYCHMGFCDATADTPALAICVASLLAIGIVVKPIAPLKSTWQCWKLDEAIA